MKVEWLIREGFKKKKLVEFSTKGGRGGKAPHEKYFFPNCFQDPTPALKASKKKNA